MNAKIKSFRLEFWNMVTMYNSFASYKFINSAVETFLQRCRRLCRGWPALDVLPSCGRSDHQRKSHSDI